MTSFTEQFWLELLVLVVAPCVVGPILTRMVADRAKRRGENPAHVRGIEVTFTVGWVAVAAVGVSLTLGPVSFLSSLTFSAIAGIAVTLALQTTLQNLVSGLILVQNRFLRVGDQIQFSGLKGAVVGFGPVTTVIRLEDGTLLFVSNSNLLSGPLLNFTATKRLAGEY